MSRARGVVPGLIGGAVAAVGTMYMSYAHLKQPQIALDWAALFLSGAVAGIILFFIVWGHYQKDPVPPGERAK